MSASTRTTRAALLLRAAIFCALYQPLIAAANVQDELEMFAMLSGAAPAKSAAPARPPVTQPTANPSPKPVVAPQSVPVAQALVKPQALVQPGRTTAQTQSPSTSDLLLFRPEASVKNAPALNHTESFFVAPQSGARPSRPAQPLPNMSTRDPSQDNLAEPLEPERPVSRIHNTFATPVAKQSLSDSEAGAVSEHAVRQLILQTVRQANSTNPRLLRARAEALSAKESVNEARGQRWPQIDVSGSSPTAQFGGGVNSNQSDKPAFNVNVTTTLYDFGRTRYTIESREHSALAAQVGEMAEQENAAWEISSLLTELSKQRRIIGVSQQYVARMNELTTMLRGITQADAGRRSEYTQARGQLLKAQTALESAQSRAKDIEIDLSRYLGNADIVLPQSNTWGLQPPDTPRLLQLLESHPVLRQARASVAAALSEAEATKAAGLPSVNWAVSKSTAEDERGRSQAFQTGIQVSWGLFRGGSVNAAARAAVMRAESARQQAEDQLRDLQERVRSSGQDARSLAERATLYATLTTETDRIRHDFFNQWYHLGKRTLLDVLGAESDFYGNQVSEISSRYDGYSAILRGYASAGVLNQWLSGTGVR